jgi:hypothetical protein
MRQRIRQSDPLPDSAASTAVSDSSSCLDAFLRRQLLRVFSGQYEVKAPSIFIRAAHRVRLVRPATTHFPQADRGRVVADALIEGSAWLRDESFDLDLIGFAATDPKPVLGRADGEAG